MDSLFKLVEIFNTEIIGINRDELSELEEKENDWLIGVLQEEINEYLDAYHKKDFILQIDSIMDLIYFSMGALTRMGLTSEQSEKIFRAINNANMNKVRGVKKERSISHTLDAVKPKDWHNPEIEIIKILGEK